MGAGKTSGLAWRCAAGAGLAGNAQAKELALGTTERFPKAWTVRYNLACYCAQLMEFDAAQEWLKAAMELNEMPVKRMAVEDPELDPLWQAMRDTTWQKSG